MFAAWTVAAARTAKPPGMIKRSASPSEPSSSAPPPPPPPAPSFAAAAARPGCDPPASPSL